MTDVTDETHKKGPAVPGAGESQRELDDRMLRERMRHVGRKILVLSGKGGVGKSTVATNLAVSLARAGKRVGLLDVDLHGPSVPRILGLEGQRLGPDGMGGIAPIRLSENLQVVSIGLLLDSPQDAVIWRGPMKHNVIRQFLKDVSWGELDYLVIDSPPGTGDEPLAVAQLVGPDAWAVVVTTPQDLAVADVRRSVSFCNRLGFRVAGIVENMSGLVCPHCGGHVDVFKAGGGERLAAEMGVPFLGRIPIDPQVVTSCDSGRPLVEHFADSPAAKAFAAVVEPILNPEGTPGPPGEGPTPDPAEAPKEKTTMKIAIPTTEGKLCPHFGHCDQFALVEVDEAAGTILGTTYLTPPPHEPGVLPRWLHQQGANVIIAGGMGRRAQDLFDASGVQVVVGAPAGSPQEIASAYLAGTLTAGPNVCDH